MLTEQMSHLLFHKAMPHFSYIPGYSSSALHNTNGKPCACKHMRRQNTDTHVPTSNMCMEHLRMSAIVLKKKVSDAKSWTSPVCFPITCAVHAIYRTWKNPGLLWDASPLKMSGLVMQLFNRLEQFKRSYSRQVQNYNQKKKNPNSFYPRT